MGDQLKELAKVDQFIWLDNIRRSMFGSGELQRLIDLGLRGMTSNPTIFEKAIGSGTDYDEQLRTLVDEDDPDIGVRGARDPRHSQLVRSVPRRVGRDEGP